MFLNRRDLEDGPKSFAVILSIGIPLLVSYQACGRNLVLAVPITAAFWFGTGSLWRAANRRGDVKRQRRLDEAGQRQEALRATRPEGYR